MQPRPRVKKARKEPTRERKLPKPPAIRIPWGRGASEYRPGLFILRYFGERDEACVADLFYELAREIERINAERIIAGEKPIRRPNYSSFARYFHWFKLLGLVEPADRREPSTYDFLEERVFYRLTGKGKVDKKTWRDPLGAAHPEFR